MDGEELVGIITERHYSRNVFLKGKTSPTTGRSLFKQMFYGHVASPAVGLFTHNVLGPDGYAVLIWRNNGSKPRR